MTQKLVCRLCRSELNDSPSYTLKNLPLGVQYFPTEGQLPNDEPVEIEIYHCDSCGFFQSFSSQVVYEAENSAATSISQAMLAHKIHQAENFIDKYELKGKHILEAGCGDGHFLKMLMDAGAFSAIGVEPSVKSKEASVYKNEVTIYSSFISRQNTLKEAPFDAFATFHVMEHIPDIHDFIAGIAVNLKENAVGLVEVPSSELIDEELRFYDIINDHLNYFTLRTLRIAFEMHNFEILESYRDWNGEHDVLIVRKRKAYDYSVLEESRKKTLANLSEAMDRYDPAEIAIWGASMHSLTLLSQFKTNKIKYVIDSALYKQDKFTPVSHFPIFAPDQLEKDPVKFVIVIAPRFVDEIVEDLKRSNSFKGKIAILDKETIVFK